MMCEFCFFFALILMKCEIVNLLIPVKCVIINYSENILM
jgi:hypothetical protein